MIDKKQFSDIKKEMQLFTEKREMVIQQSMDIIFLSKKIISGLHRNEPDKKLLADIKAKIKKLPVDDYDTGMARVARQEYVEAAAFFEFMERRRIPNAK